MKERFVKNLYEVRKVINYDASVEEIWKNCNRGFLESCNEIKASSRKGAAEWISQPSCLKIKERKRLKELGLTAKTEEHKRIVQEDYAKYSREVKRRLKVDKIVHFEKLAEQAQLAADMGDNIELYFIIRKLAVNKQKTSESSIRDKYGKMLCMAEQQLQSLGGIL